MYKLYINKICGVEFCTMFEIPLTGIESEEGAIVQAKRLKETLKEGYVVQIVKTTNASIGYI